MKSQKGITMLSLVIYVACFLVVAGIVGVITTYFYNNMNIIESNTSSAAEYNKLNLYMLKQIKSSGIEISEYSEVSPKTINGQEVNYITFEHADGTKNTFVHAGNMIYYNQIKLCEDVERFEISVEKKEKTTIKMLVQISNKQYTNTYVVE